MTSTVSKKRTEEEIVRAALELELDCTAAYEAAMACLKTDEARWACARFIADHREHVTALAHRAQDLHLGDVSANIITSALNKGKVSLAGVFGDRAVFAALANNETDSDTAFGVVSQRPDVSLRTAKLFEHLREDAHSHVAWIHHYLNA